MTSVAVDTSVKRLAFSIVQFLAEQSNLGSISEDAKEGLEVAIQCLERAFGLSSDQAASLSVSSSLLDIFHNATKDEMPPNSLPAEATDADKAEAEKLKTEGNDLMKSQKFLDAISCYSMAIKLDGRNAVYYCNRAAAYSKLGDHNSAVKDCRTAIEIDPKYSKAYARMGLAYSSLNQHKEAREAYSKACELEPESESYKANVKIAEENMKQTSASPLGQAGLFGNLLNSMPGGMDLGSVLGNPNLMSMASEMLSNPAMQQFASDPSFLSSMNNLLGGMGQNPSAAGGAPGGIDGLLRAGQQLAAQMQATNPELVDQLRRQMGGPEDQPPQPDGQS